MIQRTNGEKIFNVFNYIVLILLGLSTLYPFLYTLTISLSTTKAVNAGGYHLLPTWGEMTLGPYILVFKNKEIWQAYGWTVWRTVFGTTASVICTCFYGYALSRPNLIWKKFFSTVIMVAMLFHAGQIPAFLNIKSLGLLNNPLVYILPGLVTPYNIIVTKSFFVGIPEALNESAKIDGAGEFRTFFQIIVPLSKPIIMTLALWGAVGHWNSWFDSMLFMTSEQGKKYTVVQQYIQRIVNENATGRLTDLATGNNDASVLTAENLKSASIMVTVVPILMFYPFIQKFFIKGVTLGAVKG